MAGFKPDPSKEMGFKLIPDGTTVPVLIAKCEGRTEAAKSGNFAGRQHDVYDLTLRVIGGEFHGQRVSCRIWLNAERLANGDIDLYGSHKMWCDLYTAVGIKLDDNNEFIMPKNPAEWANINVTGGTMLVTVSEEEYVNKKGETKKTNRVTSVLPLDTELKRGLVAEYNKLKDQLKREEEAAKAKDAVKSGGGAFDDDDDDDLPF